MPSLDLPPAIQPRSRKTMESLFAAAREIVAREGIAGMSVHAVAARADVSVGTLYARFGDRDRFIEAFLDDFFTRAAGAEERLAAALAATASLDAAVLLLVRTLVEHYRRHRPLLRALLLHARSNPGSSFARRSAHYNRKLFRTIAKAFERFCGEIRPADFQRSIVVAIRLADGAAKEAVLFDDDTPRELRVEADVLTREVTAAVCAYLRDETASAPRARRLAGHPT